MASAILHIKDSFYFEVPKALWVAEYSGIKDEDAFPEWLVRLDQEYLDWHASRLIKTIEGSADLEVSIPSAEQLMGDYHHWLHADHANAGRTLDLYLEDAGIVTEEQLASPTWNRRWDAAKSEVDDVQGYMASAPKDWAVDKIDGYNGALSGKILIPQPFGSLKNLYEPASGLCVSKFMVIQVVVALLLGWMFVSLANKLRASGGNATRGRFSNALEAILLYMRDEVARPAIGHDGDKYVPLLWTVFFFVLGLNLMGMIPWVGAPTGAFGCTTGLAMVTFLTGLIMGSKKFGIVGFWTNQVPSMDLPAALGIPIKSLLFVIEVLGLGIKHLVLAIRLLANMFAGHIVLLGILMLAFSVQGAMSDSWWIAAPIAVVGSTLFSVLELGVAFLQAYIFTFLSALFIGAATHHH